MRGTFGSKKQSGDLDRQDPPSNLKNILLCVLAGFAGISMIALALMATSGRREQNAAIAAAQPTRSSFFADKMPSEKKPSGKKQEPDSGAAAGRAASGSAEAEESTAAQMHSGIGRVISEDPFEIYEEMNGLIYVFTSGVGAWSTELAVSADGSFIGQFHDSNMGETGDDHRNGTIYECSFSGRFSPASRVDATSYSATVEELYYDTELNGSDHYIDDEVLHVLTEPYGLLSGDEMIFYTSGKKVSEIPEAFMSWLQWSIPEGSEVLDQVVICNMSEEIAFFPSLYTPEAEYIPETTAYTEPAAPGSSGDYILPDSSSRYLTDADLDPLTREELRIARNEIYARRGRRFTDTGLQAYFDSKPWYHGTIMPNDFKESMFNDYEKKNSEYISAYEKRKGYD